MAAKDWIYVLRGGTATEWNEKNPILREKEPGVETNTGRFKIGDGHTFWEDLPYYVNQDAVAVMISEAMANAEPISSEQVTQIVTEVKSQLTLPDLVLYYQNKKA